MSSDLLALAEASELLGVSSERVRQLVVSGRIPGVRFGNAWAVPRDAIIARRQLANRPGRPLGPIAAWEAIVAGRVELSNVGRYAHRGKAHRYEMSRADVDHLLQSGDVLVSGTRAAIELGAPLASDPKAAELYAPAELHERLDAMVAAVADPLGGVVVRVVPADAWAYVDDEAALNAQVPSGVAPRGAVALDLMESADPRLWLAAADLVGG